jgi:hypothetical protein
METNPSIEARAWLRDTIAVGAFAGNRFHTTHAALEFVEGLYASGAVEVLIEDPGHDSDGDPYADALAVRCPVESDACRCLADYCEDEGPGDCRRVTS